jgi:hypothetical protein
MIYLYLGLLIGGCVGFFAAGLMRVAKITELESDLRSASSRLSWALKEAEFWKAKYERLDTAVHGDCVAMAMQDPAVFREKINQMQRALDKITGVKEAPLQEKQQ